jgi:hypothetical protein
VSIRVRLPEQPRDYDLCNACGDRPTVAIIEFTGGHSTSIERVCAPCGHELSTQLQELNL